MYNKPINKDVSDLNFSDERIAHIVRKVTREFYTSLDRRLQPYGVNHGFWAYLRELWNEEGISQRLLSDRVGLTGPTTNSVIKRMVTLGLIELRPIVEGKPRCVVYLTPKGHALRDTLEPLAKEVNDIAVQEIDAEDIDRIRCYLLKIYSNLLGDNA